MDISGLLIEAAQLMLIGMFVVFMFLGILVWLTTLLAKFAGSEDNAPVATAKAATVASTEGISPQTIAAISAAIHQYRQSSFKAENKNRSVKHV